MTKANRRHPPRLNLQTVGVGFKAEHFDPIVETRPELGFFEVHAENYMGAGGPPHRRLDAIRERYPAFPARRRLVDRLAGTAR